MKRLFMVAFLILSFTGVALAGTKIADAPGGQDTSAGGSEKIPVDDAGTGKYMTVDTLLARALAAYAWMGSINGLTEADVSVLETTADNTYNVVTSGGNNYILGSNSDNSALEFKTPANVLSQIGAQATDADLTSLAGGVTGIVKGAGDGNGYSAATAGTDYSMPYNVRVECTADTNLTEIQCWNTHVTNQGAAGEVDLKLYATSYGCAVTFISEEAQVIEINPPTDEILYLNGTALDTNDCVDSDGVEGSMIKAFRHKDSSGAWHWYLITITGVWADTGASD